MFDTAIEDIQRNSIYHPQKPRFNGSFQYQLGAEKTYFFRTGRYIIDNPNSTGKEDDKFIIPIGLALTAKWIWIDGSWKITVDRANDQPTPRRKNWIKWTGE